jgi:4-amino-4-deoxy-L-arabinose transferase
MTKGPPGLLALVPIVVVDVRRARQGRRPLVWSWTGLLLCAAVGLWWYLLLVFEDAARLRYFLVGEVWNRVFTDAHRRENTPLIHVGALTIGILPWAFGYLDLGRQVRAWWRTTPRRIADEPLLLVVWIIPALVVFLIARSRLPLYTAPLVCPIAVLFARAWCRRPAGPPALARSLPALFAIAAVMVTGLHFLRASQGAPEIRTAAEAVQADKQSAAVIVNATGFPRGSLNFFAGRDVETRAPGQAVPDGRDVYLFRSAKDAHPLPEEPRAATEIFRGKKFAMLRLKRRGE